jgi:hypothetical protein
MLHREVYWKQETLILIQDELAERIDNAPIDAQYPPEFLLTYRHLLIKWTVFYLFFLISNSLTLALLLWSFRFLLGLSLCHLKLKFLIPWYLQISSSLSLSLLWEVIRLIISSAWTLGCTLGAKLNSWLDYSLFLIFSTMIL